MRAAVLKGWHDLEITDIDTPKLGVNECLIKVKYAGVCGSDVHIFEGGHPTAKAPIILCHEILGEIIKINAEDNRGLAFGDKVVVQPLISCGKCEACRNGHFHVCRDLKLIGIHENGGFAEYVKANIDKIIKVSDIPDDIAVLTEPLAVALHIVRRSNLKVGQKALVIGGGPIGIAVAIMAKLAGASKVIISEMNENRLQLIKGFGFDTIDASCNGVMERIEDISQGEGFDAVYEVTGTKNGVETAISACKIRGTIVHVGFPGKPYEYNHLPIIFKELSIVGSRVYTMDDFKDALSLIKLIVDDEIYDLRKYISDILPLEDVSKAIDMMIKGNNLAKIVIKI